MNFYYKDFSAECKFKHASYYKWGTTRHKFTMVVLIPFYLYEDISLSKDNFDFIIDKKDGDVNQIQSKVDRMTISSSYKNGDVRVHIKANILKERSLSKGEIRLIKINSIM
jgi:hypothetical protein